MAKEIQDNKISFIVIGKNIEITIDKCLSSIHKFIKYNKIENYEIIYIDSNSTDNSIEIAKKYSTNIYVIKGETNAAIARNVGAQKSKGEILFFIDGDMELILDFYTHAFHNHILVYPFIRGYHIHKFYNEDDKIFKIIEENLPSKPLYKSTSGGLILIEKWLWNKLNGMDERLIRNQDIDFGLRSSDLGFKNLMINKHFVIHHTKSYFSNKRFQSFVFSKALLAPGLMLRKHIFNPSYLYQYKVNLFYTLLLSISIISTPFNLKISLYTIIAFIIINLVRAIKQFNKESNIINSFLFKIAYSVNTFFGFLFYFPSNNKYSIIKIK